MMELEKINYGEPWKCFGVYVSEKYQEYNDILDKLKDIAYDENIPFIHPIDIVSSEKTLKYDWINDIDVQQINKYILCSCILYSNSNKCMMV